MPQNPSVTGCHRAGQPCVDSPGSHPPRSDGPQGVVAGPAAPEHVLEEPVLCPAQTHPCSLRHRSLERFQGDAAVHSPVTATTQVTARASSAETHILIIFSSVTQSNVSKNPGHIPGTTPGTYSGRKLSFRSHPCLLVSTAPRLPGGLQGLLAPPWSSSCPEATGLVFLPSWVPVPTLRFWKGTAVCPLQAGFSGC